MSKLEKLSELDVPGWTDRIGGPTGRHAQVTKNLWFDPVPWTILASIFTWLVLMLRQLPCWQTDIDKAPNTYGAMCYSDIPILYQARDNIWSGAPLFASNTNLESLPLEYPTLTGGFIWLARWLSGLFGAVINPMALPADRLAASNIFWAVNTAMLFVCFGFLVWAHLQMGRNSGSAATGGIRTRAWDALFIAAAPVVMLSGLINWDLFAVALTSLGLLLWARQHPIWAGLLIGLAVAAKFYPLALIPAIFLLCLRARKVREWAIMVASAGVVWLAINLPMFIIDRPGWAFFWQFNAERTADLGSLWYILELMGLKIGNVSLIEILCLALSGGLVIGLTLSAPKRPRLGQVLWLVLAAFLIFNKVYSPQYVLWLLPVLVLARPVIFDAVVFFIAEACYFFAIWGFLGGTLGIGTGDDRLYWFSVFFRIAVQIWICARVIRDIWRPWLDPVRGPFIDDPIGGVLDHAVDAGWLLRYSPGEESDLSTINDQELITTEAPDDLVSEDLVSEVLAGADSS